MLAQGELLQLAQHRLLSGGWDREDDDLGEVDDLAHVQSDARVRGALNRAAGSQIAFVDDIAGMLQVGRMRIYQYACPVAFEIRGECKSSWPRANDRHLRHHGNDPVAMSM